MEREDGAEPGGDRQGPGAGERGGEEPGTCTDHARVLEVVAVVLSPAGVGTVLQRILRARAAHVVQQDGSRARAEGAAPRGPQRAAAAQKAAHDAGVLDVPVVVAHRAPHALVPDLNAALARAAAARQAQARACGR